MRKYVSESGWSERIIGPLSIVQGPTDSIDDWAVFDLILRCRKGWWAMTLSFRLPGFSLGLRWLDDDREATS